MQELKYSGSEAETEALGAKLAKTLSAGDFVALYGTLGAGKTAFVRGMASELGCSRVSSPTFTIVNEYTDGALPIFHFDVYRLEDETELYEMGYEDYFERGGAIVMEWSENVPDALPEKRVDVTLEYDGADHRKITFEDKRV